MLDNVKIEIEGIHIHFDGGVLLSALDDIINRLGDIEMNQDEMAVALAAAADQTDKVIAEVQASTVALQAAIVAAGVTSPAVDAALARLQASLATADALNPDAAPAVDVVAP